MRYLEVAFSCNHILLISDGMTSLYLKVLSNSTTEAEEILEMVGLEQRKIHKPSALSGGQQQRDAIVRALITHPTVLLADEPTGALAPKIGQAILALFRDLNQQGNTIIQMTHDSTVAKVGSRSLTLRDGVLWQQNW